MFRPLSIYIGLRYTCSKRRNHFISFISLASMLGIALGVTVLITVLSVMNGFDYEIHNRIFTTAEQVKITGINNTLSDWPRLAKQTAALPQVAASTPFVAGQGMISYAGAASGVLVSGVLPEFEQNVSSLNTSMTQGTLPALKAGKFGALIGQDLALRLNLGIGDKLVLITPQATASPIGVTPRFKRFTVVGIFHFDGRFSSYDSGMVFIHLNDAQKLFQLGQNTVSGLRLKVKSLYDAPLVAEKLEALLPQEYLVTDWTREYGAYFDAIRMEKTTMFVVLMFIIAVAAFNLVSSLVMTVNDKRPDIAILRTLGASPRTIMSIFMVQGSIIGCVGTLLGVIGGIALAINAPALVKLLEYYCHTNFISSSVYFINYLPSRLIWTDVLHIGIAALAMSFVATIYPAWRAAQTQPAEALRYE